MQTILIADDHEIVRNGIRMMIETIPGEYHFIEVTTCEEVVKELDAQVVHFALLDMSLADGSILSALEPIAAHSWQTKILVYSMNAARIYAWRLIQKGVKGFVEKQASMEELEKAIREVLRGEVYLSPELKKVLLDPMAKQLQGNPLDSLSDRELEVVEYLASGLGAKEISHKMAVDITTVSTFRRRAFEKLDVQNVVELKLKFSLYTGG